MDRCRHERGGRCLLMALGFVGAANPQISPERANENRRAGAEVQGRFVNRQKGCPSCCIRVVAEGYASFSEVKQRSGLRCMDMLVKS